MGGPLNLAHNVADLGHKTAGLVSLLPKPYKAISREHIDGIIKKIAEDDTIPYCDRIALIQNIEVIIKHYSNKRNIIEKADKYLTKSLNDLNPIDESWADFFFEECKNISDDEIQHIWAKILAQECENPSSISKRFINELKLLDTQTARDFQLLNKLKYSVEFYYGDCKIDELNNALGLITPSSTFSDFIDPVAINNLCEERWLMFDSNCFSNKSPEEFNKVKVTYGDRTLLFSCVHSNEYNIGCFIFSKIGNILSNILDKEFVDSRVEKIIDYHTSLGYTLISD